MVIDKGSFWVNMKSTDSALINTVGRDPASTEPYGAASLEFPKNAQRSLEASGRVAGGQAAVRSWRSL